MMTIEAFGRQLRARDTSAEQRPDVEIVDDVLRDERRAERDVDGLVRELRELVERRDAVVRALRRRPHRPRTCRGLVAGASAAGARE